MSKSQKSVQSAQEESNLPTIRNPIKVRTKGRPKTGENDAKVLWINKGHEKEQK